MKPFFYILSIIPLLGQGQIYGDKNVARIQDDDGYTWIRARASISSEIVDTLWANEYFLYQQNDTSDWYFVNKLKHRGFAHKSTVVDLSSIPRSEQRRIIVSVLEKEADIYSRHMKGEIPKGDPDYYYHDNVFRPINQLLLNFTCAQYDEMLILQYFDLLVLESESADETPSNVLGYIYQCQSEELDATIEAYNHPMIVEHLKFGRLNVEIEK